MFSNCGTSLLQKEVENVIKLDITIFEPQQPTTNIKILPKSSKIIGSMATYHQFLRHLNTINATWYMVGRSSNSAFGNVHVVAIVYISRLCCCCF